MIAEKRTRIRDTMSGKLPSDMADVIIASGKCTHTELWDNFLI